MSVTAWLREQWFWLRWGLVVLALLVGGTIIARRLAKAVRRVSQPATWKPVGNHAVAVRNPTSGAFEIVALPDDVTARDVVAVGISAEQGAYEVETVHVATDRHGDAVSDSGLDL